MSMDVKILNLTSWEKFDVVLATDWLKALGKIIACLPFIVKTK